MFKKKREHNNNILFIDASKDFEKIKTQNYLREQDMDKIVDTYKARKSVEKYAHVAGLKEIADNEYNLNIPRYVDTFEAEEEIDLKKVAQELKSIDKELQSTDKTIAGFCKELGIETPF